MKCFRLNIAAARGFTLVEIIATIVIMGILSAFFIHFMGTALADSWKSVDLVAGEAAAEAKLEEIIAYFTSKINDDSQLDNAISIVASQFSDDATLEFIVFIVSDGSGVEAPDLSGENRTLKVTVEAPGNNLTTILTQSRTESSDPKVGY
jgi:prepilin-type N-terminal cleavage/methylation domain-containing protein